MTKKVRINGIYDLRTIKALSSLDIKHIGFDFRPKSFNFIQTYKVVEFLEENISNFETIYLHFCHEKDFVITSIINEVLGTGLRSDQIVLEFSDDNEQVFYEQFGLPYIIHIDETLRELKNDSYISGLCFHTTNLDDLSASNNLASYTNQIMTSYYEIIKKPGFKKHLIKNWNDELYSGYDQFLKFDFITLTIGPLVEVCYRNVNIAKLKPYFEKLPLE